GSRLAAVLAALVYAVTFEAVHVSRLAFPSNTLPLVQAATFYFFWRGWRRKEHGGGRWSLAISGLFLGLAVQSYYAGLAIVAGMGLAWAVWLWRERRQALPGAIAFWLAFLVPTLPWLLLVAPQVLGSQHTGGQFVLSPAVNQGAPLQLLARQMLEHAALFGFTGDQIWRHNLPGRPFFDLPLALFFWGGVVLALVRVRRAAYAFLLVQLIFGILPGALARTDTGPVILHLTAMFVPACVFPALSMDWLADKAGAWRRWARPTVAALFCILLGATAVRTYVDYFQTWTEGVAGSMSLDELFVETAQVMNQRSADGIDAWVLPMSGSAGSDGQARSLDFVYDQATPAVWVAANDNTAGAVLQQALTGRQRVALVTWDWDALKWAAPAYSDEKGLLPFLLAQNGRLVEQQAYYGFTVDIYDLASDLAFDSLPDRMHASEAAFGDGSLTLSGYVHGEAALSDEPLWLALQWQASTPPGRDLKAAVTLVDPAGHVIVQDDQLLRNAAGESSVSWPA
ncbi:MAG: phospholipid carrier-dependent glycosyltransferase, partial [Xanthomonadales bacterium]|nr:phospholipid carrier-dependent glycosyltransferase [Xanthomonadales bacterium]